MPPTLASLVHHSALKLTVRAGEDRLDVPVRWEAVADSPLWFPHVHGPIPVEAVVEVHDFPPLPDGSFVLPEAVAVL